jgi:hypothetical protein
MTSKKCPSCGLVNLASDETCRRCGAALDLDAAAPQPTLEEDPVKPKRSFLRRVIWILSATLTILVIWYVSLIVSSEGLNSNQNQAVSMAINVLEQKGFTSNAFVLRRLVSYRSTDNWWNRYTGHRDAYAATNFPFEVLTLYPEFFSLSLDDTERAAMLLHESYHLFGHGEEAALEGAWLDKQRLGWTADKYERSRVWNATRQLTIANVPKLFKCGPDHHSDCLQVP